MFYINGIKLRNITGAPFRWVNPYESPKKAKYTDASWYLASTDSMCAYCGTVGAKPGERGLKFDRDHVLPFSRKAEWLKSPYSHFNLGKDFFTSEYNIVLSCTSCNSKKADKTLIEHKDISLNYPPTRIIEYIFNAEMGIAYLDLIKSGSPVLTHIDSLIKTYGRDFVRNHWRPLELSPNVTYNPWNTVPNSTIYQWFQKNLPPEDEIKGKDVCIDLDNVTFRVMEGTSN